MLEATALAGLKERLEPLPARLKKAIFVASKTGNMQQGTWNGCVMNKAAATEGMNIKSHLTMAMKFDCEPQLILSFISFWDAMSFTTAKCNHLLRVALHEIGFGEPQPEFKKRTSFITGRKVVNKYHNEALAKINAEFMELVEQIEDTATPLSEEACSVLEDAQMLVGAL